MPNYYMKSQKDTYDANLAQASGDAAPTPPPVYSLVEATEDTVVQTAQYGEVLVTAGNYVATDEAGNQFGVAAADVGSAYVPAP